jgi:hypothetical protein
MNRGPQLRGTQIGGLILIGLGLLFVLDQVFHINLIAISWPFFIIVPGVALIAVGLSSDRMPMTIFGSIVTVTGLILLYQSLFGHYQSWAYAWALYPVAAGLGQIAHGMANHQPEQIEQGKRVVAVGLVLFVLGWIFFEMIIGISGYRNPLGNFVGPVILIGLGVYILYRQSRQIGQR